MDPPQQLKSQIQWQPINHSLIHFSPTHSTYNSLSLHQTITKKPLKIAPHFHEDCLDPKMFLRHRNKSSSSQQNKTLLERDTNTKTETTIVDRKNSSINKSVDASIIVGKSIVQLRPIENNNRNSSVKVYEMYLFISYKDEGIASDLKEKDKIILKLNSRIYELESQLKEMEVMLNTKSMDNQAQAYILTTESKPETMLTTETSVTHSRLQVPLPQHGKNQLVSGNIANQKCDKNWILKIDMNDLKRKLSEKFQNIHKESKIFSNSVSKGIPKPESIKDPYKRSLYSLYNSQSKKKTYNEVQLNRSASHNTSECFPMNVKKHVSYTAKTTPKCSMKSLLFNKIPMGNSQPSLMEQLESVKVRTYTLIENLLERKTQKQRQYNSHSHSKSNLL